MEEKLDRSMEEELLESLNSVSKKFKNYVADQSGNYGDNEIVDRENIFNGKNQSLSLAIGMRKLAHQKV